MLNKYFGMLDIYQCAFYSIILKVTMGTNKERVKIFAAGVTLVVVLNLLTYYKTR